MHVKDLKTNNAPAAMVNWQEAGRRWPQPHPHVARLLSGLLWDQQYRYSNPQCEGGMPGSFELREDMGEDRLRAVEEWLRAEGYEYRFRRKRWRTWTRPDRPGEGLRPDGIEEDEDPQRLPVGRLDQRLHVGLDREEVPGTGERAQAAGQQQRVSGDGEEVRRGQEAGPEVAGVPGVPGCRSRPRRQGRNPQPPVPNGPMVDTTPAPPPLATTSKSPGRPRASPVRCS